MTPNSSLLDGRPPVLWAAMTWDHMGTHSGMRPLWAEIETIRPGFTQPVVGEPFAGGFAERWDVLSHRLFQRCPQWMALQSESPLYSRKAWTLERQIHHQVMRTNPSAVVLESIDDQLYILAEKRKSWPTTRLIGICHQPPAWWRLHHARPDLAKSLDTLIVLTASARPFWEQWIEPEKLVTILHGVDADFFCPDETETKPSTDDGILRAVFVGQWMRDFETLATVVAMTDQWELPVSFDMVVPRKSRGTDAMHRIAMSPRVRWHSSLSDENLRRLYRQSDLLLLTLTDCTANNALLEGMSCGLPVLVTDVGGVRDYARDNFADFVRPREAAPVIEMLRGYLGQKNKLKSRGDAAREHVKNHLSWKKIAADYLALLHRLNDET